MSPRTRTQLFLISALGLAAIFTWGFRNLPPIGDYRGPYGNLISQVAVYERHTTDVVNSINYDYRACDTLGEEFILFASVLGVLLIFRPSTSSNEARNNQKNKSEKRQPWVEDQLPVSDSLRVGMMAMSGLMIVFGVYIAVHGQLTPGGGFQGGVILSSVPLVVYLSGNVKAFDRIVSASSIKFAECCGAAAYAIIGTSALFFGTHFLTNIVPLGATGDPFSSGTIAIISICVGLEVSGAFVVLMEVYLREVIDERLGKKS
jgi:multicomponent Na+:H+ antiporter subunit B